MPEKAGTMMMEVKVDPGAQPSCIPLHRFKTLFPNLCRDGLPREELLDITQNEFQSYNGADMTCYGRKAVLSGTLYTGSSSQKKQHSSKTVTASPSRRVHSFQDAKIQGREMSRESSSGKDVNFSDEEQHTQEDAI